MTQKTVMDKAIEYVKWVAAHNIMPRRHSQDKEESNLSGWFHAYKQVVNDSTSVSRMEHPAVTKYLKDSLGSDVFDNMEARCMGMAERYVKFFENHERKPSASTGRLLEEELDNWYHKYRKAVNNPGKGRAAYHSVTMYMRDHLGAGIFITRAATA